MNRRRRLGLRHVLLLTALMAAMTLIFKGGYMQAKAHFAQFLIEQAWDKTLADRQQHKPWSWADTYPVAKLHFVDEQGRRRGAPLFVLAGASGRNLAFGPAAILANNQINHWGNTVIAGHRDTHFARLEGVHPGQVITLQDASAKTVSYRVLGTKVVDEQDTALLAQEDALRLTLVTCYPFDSLGGQSRQRFVVVAAPMPGEETVVTRLSASPDRPGLFEETEFTELSQFPQSPQLPRLSPQSGRLQSGRLQSGRLQS
ncbi:class GN sortase [Shewanella insulae]|uniref:class GN sortase n=1 Tax=Shewanella insulae TaxID=2681496 RepID=UPI001EFDABE2|nr:class GN sortase [Shewanella insulae]MCG9738995.1 class GN sortase [Shewanella insulae]